MSEELNTKSQTISEEVFKDAKVGGTASLKEISEVMSLLSKDSGNPLTAKSAQEVIKLFKDAVIECLKNKQKVQLVGFLTLKPAYRSERQGINLVTKEPMNIPETISIVAKAGTQLKAVCKEMDYETVQAFKALSAKDTTADTTA